jgi:hypothetical protein
VITNAIIHNDIMHAAIKGKTIKHNPLNSPTKRANGLNRRGLRNLWTVSVSQYIAADTYETALSVFLFEYIQNAPGIALLTSQCDGFIAEFKASGIDSQDTTIKWLHLPGDFGLRKGYLHYR